MASFSLFNFMPETAPPKTDAVVDLEAEPVKGHDDDKKKLWPQSCVMNSVLDVLAPTAWYNEKKTSQKAKVGMRRENEA